MKLIKIKFLKTIFKCKTKKILTVLLFVPFSKNETRPSSVVDRQPQIKGVYLSCPPQKYQFPYIKKLFTNKYLKLQIKFFCSLNVFAFCQSIILFSSKTNKEKSNTIIRESVAIQPAMQNQSTDSTLQCRLQFTSRWIQIHKQKLETITRLSNLATISFLK